MTPVESPSANHRSTSSNFRQRPPTRPPTALCPQRGLGGVVMVVVVVVVVVVMVVVAVVVVVVVMVEE